MRFLFGEDEAVAGWVSWQLFRQPDYFTKVPAIGLIDGHELICGVVYTEFGRDAQRKAHSMQLSIASTTPKWANRQTLHTFFAYPFLQLGCRRIWTQCSAENEQVISFNERLGFTAEGIHREAWPLGGDAISWGMLKDECKWLRS